MLCIFVNDTLYFKINDLEIFTNLFEEIYKE